MYSHHLKIKGVYGEKEQERVNRGEEKDERDRKVRCVIACDD